MASCFAGAGDRAEAGAGAGAGTRRQFSTAGMFRMGFVEAGVSSLRKDFESARVAEEAARGQIEATSAELKTLSQVMRETSRAKMTVAELEADDRDHTECKTRRAVASAKVAQMAVTRATEGVSSMLRKAGDKRLVVQLRAFKTEMLALVLAAKKIATRTSHCEQQVRASNDLHSLDQLDTVDKNEEEGQGQDGTSAVSDSLRMLIHKKHRQLDEAKARWQTARDGLTAIVRTVEYIAFAEMTQEQHAEVNAVLTEATTIIKMTELECVKSEMSCAENILLGKENCYSMDEEEDSLDATITKRRAKMTSVERILEDLLCVEVGAKRVEESLKSTQETAERAGMSEVVSSVGEVAARSSLVARQAHFAAVDLKEILSSF
jgi:hypothetical protein